MSTKRYPSKTTILKTKPDIPQIMINITKIWKREFLKEWKTTSCNLKIERLQLLATTLNSVSTKNKKLEIELDNVYCYNTKKKTIHLNVENPSIVSTLHELGHHLHGTSELKACRFSVWLFKECFPKQFKNLEWNQHLLVKRK